MQGQIHDCGGEGHKVGSWVEVGMEIAYHADTAKLSMPEYVQ